MGRAVGIGVIGFGWMGRLHASSYRRVVEHFPDIGVRPRLVIAADASPARRAQAADMGFGQTTDDWRAVVAHADVDAVSITLPNAMHRDVALAAIDAGKDVWIEKPVGRGLADTVAVADAAHRAGVVTGVGFCYRFSPAVQHAKALIQAGRIGDVTRYRGVFLAGYADRPDAAASWRFLREEAGSGALGDLMAHVVDMTHFLAGPITRVSGRTATTIPRRPALPAGEGTHFTRVDAGELVDVENEDWAAALFELEGGALGTLEASRVIVGARAQMRFEVHGSRGALQWDLERMNELERFQLAEDGGDEGYTTILAGPQHGDFGAFQPGAGLPMGYDDLRVIEARAFLAAVRDGEQGEPGIDDMVACARVLAAIERSARSGAWEATAGTTLTGAGEGTR